MLPWLHHTHIWECFSQKVFFVGPVRRDKDKVTHWQPGHTTHIHRQTTSIQWAMRWMLTSGNQRCDSSTDHWWQISCHDSFPRLLISELSCVRLCLPYIWFKDCTHDNWYHATMFSDIVSLCSKLINCSICDCFVNPNDADVILTTAHNMEASLWPLQCPECFRSPVYYDSICTWDCLWSLWSPEWCVPIVTFPSQSITGHSAQQWCSRPWPWPLGKLWEWWWVTKNYCNI